LVDFFFFVFSVIKLRKGGIDAQKVEKMAKLETIRRIEMAKGKSQTWADGAEMPKMSFKKGKMTKEMSRSKLRRMASQRAIFFLNL
jgi:hypothetical protein